jgi:hypothetical protein
MKANQTEESQSKPIRVVFTEGGKGGVGKTEVALSLVSWYRQRGIEPALLDFDIENAEKSSLQSFYQEATKLDVHREGTLDELFAACDNGASVVLADLGSGAGRATQQWFEEASEYAFELSIQFTAVGVTTNEAGSIQSILRWADNLQDAVDYLIVLNEMRTPRCAFEYWHDDPMVAEFVNVTNAQVMTMKARFEAFQAEARNAGHTLQDIIERRVKDDFFRMTKNVIRAKIYQQNLFDGFDVAENILLPKPLNH